MTHDKARAAVAAPAIPVTVGTAEKKDVPIAFAILAVLVVAGLLLVDRLRSVSALQDCLMTPGDPLRRDRSVGTSRHLPLN
jgi:hypothetical protein